MNIPSNIFIAYLVDFQSKLDSFSALPSSLASTCFDPPDFVITPNIYAAIESTRDWIAKLSSSTPLDSACRSDLIGLRSPRLLHHSQHLPCHRVHPQLDRQARPFHATRLHLSLRPH
ncbi:hypothetical protein U1Q18_029933 [Sarracenia purpurea var. burkii]